MVDDNALNPELGGEPAFARLSAALARADIGLILDFVPNHMGVDYADNAWWLDVLEWGPNSPHAAAFDIDWKAHAMRRTGRVLLPILGKPYGEALDRGEIELRLMPPKAASRPGTSSTGCRSGRDRYGEILRTAVDAPHRRK